MQEHIDWRVEQFTDEMDPFANIQWYVMQGNVVIAQCEVESHAERIVAEHQRFGAYEQALQHITGMTRDTHDIDAAIDAAHRGLQRGQ